jgi:uncharacterized alpha-E superfamily protein
VKFCRGLGLIADTAEPSTSLRDERNPQGIVADIRRLSWCASQVRARLSTSYWRAVADMQRQLQDALAAREEPRAVLDQLLLCLAALGGFALDDMTQDAGWRLLRVGRRLERLQFASGLLAAHLASDAATHAAHIEWLLEAYDSIRVYRSRYVVSPRLAPLVDLLVRDSEHPRALCHLSQGIEQDLTALAHSLNTFCEDALQAPLPVLTDDSLLVLEGDDPLSKAERQALATRLRALASDAGRLSDRLSLRHFSHISLDSQALAI